MRRLLLLTALVACSSEPPVLVPDASKSTLTPEKTSGIPAGEAVRVDVVVRDADSQVIQGVQLSATLDDDVLDTGGLTDNEGHASFGAVSDVVGTKTLTVKARDVTLGTVALEFVPGPPVGLEFVQQPVNGKVGEVLAPVVLRTVDHKGNVSPGPLEVSLRLVRTPGGMLSGGELRTAVDGGVTFDMLSINRPQVGCALRAESPAGPAAESDTFDVAPGDPDTGMSTLVAAPTSTMVNMQVTLTLTVRDRLGNALSSVPVTLSVDGTGNTLGASSGTTGGNGVFETTLTSSVPELKTVTATAGTATVTTTVTFVF